MDDNMEKQYSEEESQNSDQPQEPAAEEPQSDRWYTSDQIMGDQPLDETGTPVEAPLQPEIVDAPASYAPPPAAAAPAAKKNNTSMIIWIVLLVVLCCSCICLFLVITFASSLLGGIYEVVIDILNSIFNGFLIFE